MRAFVHHSQLVLHVSVEVGNRSVGMDRKLEVGFLNYGLDESLLQKLSLLYVWILKLCSTGFVATIVCHTWYLHSFFFFKGATSTFLDILFTKRAEFDPIHGVSRYVFYCEIKLHSDNELLTSEVIFKPGNRCPGDLELLTSLLRYELALLVPLYVGGCTKFGSTQLGFK